MTSVHFALFHIILLSLSHSGCGYLFWQSTQVTTENGLVKNNSEFSRPVRQSSSSILTLLPLQNLELLSPEGIN